MVFGINGVGSYAYDQLSGTDFNRSAGDLIRNKGKLVRLNPSFSNVSYVTNLNTATYAGLIFTLTQRLHNLNYQASYTWSHALDYGTCNTRFDYNGAPTAPPTSITFRQTTAIAPSMSRITSKYPAATPCLLPTSKPSSIMPWAAGR